MPGISGANSNIARASGASTGRARTTGPGTKPAPTASCNASRSRNGRQQRAAPGPNSGGRIKPAPGPLGPGESSRGSGRRHPGAAPPGLPESVPAGAAPTKPDHEHRPCYASLSHGVGQNNRALTNTRSERKKSRRSRTPYGIRPRRLTRLTGPPAQPRCPSASLPTISIQYVSESPLVDHIY
jgi:hypothetical protein